MAALPVPSPLTPTSVTLISPLSQPLWTRSFPASAQADLAHTHLAFAALDYVDTAVASGSGAGPGREGYLGLLLVLDGEAVYGYKPSSNIVIILTLPLTTGSIRDADVLTILHAIHQAYLQTISNPFHPQPTSNNPHLGLRWDPALFVASKSLERRVGNVVRALGGQA